MPSCLSLRPLVHFVNSSCSNYGIYLCPVIYSPQSINIDSTCCNSELSKRTFLYCFNLSSQQVDKKRFHKLNNGMDKLNGIPLHRQEFMIHNTLFAKCYIVCSLIYYYDIKSTSSLRLIRFRKEGYFQSSTTSITLRVTDY